MQNTYLKDNENQNFTDYLKIQSVEAMGLSFEIAGIGARSHAFIIDWHIRLLLALTWLLLCGIALFSFQELFNAPWKGASMSLVYLWLVPAAILYFFYHPVLEIAMSGKTPGKRMAGLKIVTNDGLTPSSGALLLRNVFRLLDTLPGLYILGLGFVAFTKHHVRIGDLAANLVLVYDNEVSQKELEQVRHLTLNSKLKSSDQMLLLDLSNRWKQLSLDDRIRLSEKFLVKIGQPVDKSDTNKKVHSKYLLAKLQKLIEAS